MMPWLSPMLKILTFSILNWKKWKLSTFSFKTDRKSTNASNPKKLSKLFSGKTKKFSENFKCNLRISSRIKSWKEITSRCSLVKISSHICLGDFLLLWDYIKDLQFRLHPWNWQKKTVFCSLSWIITDQIRYLRTGFKWSSKEKTRSQRVWAQVKEITSAWTQIAILKTTT